MCRPFAADKSAHRKRYGFIQMNSMIVIDLQNAFKKNVQHVWSTGRIYSEWQSMTTTNTFFFLNGYVHYANKMAINKRDFGAKSAHSKRIELVRDFFPWFFFRTFSEPPKCHHRMMLWKCFCMTTIIQRHIQCIMPPNKPRIK